MWIEIVIALMGLSQDPVKAQNVAAVTAAKRAIVREIDPATPNIPFEAWMGDLVVGALTTWEVNDCGEQTGNPQQDKGRDFPMCAEVIVALSGQRELHVSLVVGTFKKSVGGQPQLWMAYVKKADGSIAWVKRLSDIPAAIRHPVLRPLPAG